MSGFALPPDPDEKKRKKQEAKEEAAKPKVPPEIESRHRMIFALVLYCCLLVLMLLLIPAVGSAFNTRTRIPGPEDASPMVQSIWQFLDQIVEVRRHPREANVLKAFEFGGAGPLWWMTLLPPLLIVGIQLGVKDKAAASKLHYLVALGMVLTLIALGAVAIAEVVSMQQSAAGA